MVSSSKAKLNLDEVIRTEVLTPRSILNSMMEQPDKRATLTSLISGQVVTVQHDYGSFVMTWDDVQDYLAVRRLRGEV